MRRSLKSVPEDAPIIEEFEDQDERELAIEDEKRQKEAEEGGEEAMEEVVQVDSEEEGQQEGEEGQKEDEEIEEKEEVEVGATRVCIPMESKDKHVVLRTVIDLYLRLKADGYEVRQLHTDRGGEYTSKVMKDWCTQRTILHTFTPGDSPQTNGRAENAVQNVKSEIRRVLHGAGAEFNRWPLAARFINEVNRLKQIGKTVKHPKFLSEVLVRKRFWRSREMAPTQEKVIYLGPSWVNHGHWVERPGGAEMLTRMVMFDLKEPPEEDHWIALEDGLTPLEERRRLRGKQPGVFHMKVREEDSHGAEGGLGESLVRLAPVDEEEEEQVDSRSQNRVQETIRLEMINAMNDNEMVAGLVVDSIAALKECQVKNDQVQEVLQTRIVSQSEMKRDLDLWKPAIQAELDSLLEKKKALKEVAEDQVKKWLEQDEVEVLPSKLVLTLKPSPDSPGGKRKVRLVACGNYQEGENDPSELYAGGATAVSLRAALSAASQMKWFGRILDIKTAFLNAPMVSEQQRILEEVQGIKKKRPVIRPPGVLLSSGFVKPNTFWEADKALYGYRKSPRLWGDYRDQVVATMKIPFKNGCLRLHQMVSEPNLWRVVYVQDEETGETGEMEFVGMMLVYVDDILILGDMTVIDSVTEALQNQWETSQPEDVVSEKGVRFLGTEVWRSEEGIWATTQSHYTTDLLVRNLGPDQESWEKKRVPIVKEPVVSENPSSHSCQGGSAYCGRARVVVIQVTS